MFTHLKFTSPEKQEIIFTACELIHIAEEVMHDAITAAQQSRPQNRSHIHAVPNSKDSKFSFSMSDILPDYIETPKSITDWLYILSVVSNRDTDARKGWWICLAGILHHLRRQEKDYDFYIDQYGRPKDIYHNISFLIDKIPLLPRAWSRTGAVPFTKETLLAWYDENVLKPHKEQRDTILNRRVAAAPDQSALTRQLSDSMLETNARLYRARKRYLEEIFIPQAVGSISTFKAVAAPLLDKKQLTESDEERLKLLENKIKAKLLRSLAAQAEMDGTLCLIQMPFVTPGKKGLGCSYPEFEQALVSRYPALKDNGSFWNVILASAMRVNLQIQDNESIDTSNHILTALLAAWFISEPSRNPVSFLSGLQLLDLIESGAEYYDEQKRENLYTIRHLLVHPAQPDCDDAKQREKLNRIAGMHPMTHTGSASDKMSKAWQLVREKEAHILIDWLKRIMHDSEALSKKSPYIDFSQKKFQEQLATEKRRPNPSKQAIADLIRKHLKTRLDSFEPMLPAKNLGKDAPEPGHPLTFFTRSQQIYQKVKDAAEQRGWAWQAYAENLEWHYGMV